MEIGGRNLILNTSSNFRSVTVFQYGASHLFRVPIDSEKISHGDEVTFSVYIKDIPVGERVRLRLDWYRDDNTYGAATAPMSQFTDKNGRLTFATRIPNDTSYTNVRGRIMPDNWKNSYQIKIKEEQLEKGNKATDYSPAPEDMATQSQITQLSNAINLRVQKGDVINQINISDESILIAGRRIHITGQTTIDNATIKSAHILSLDAGKITTGTLDAGKISVINLSANSIVGGILSSQNDNMTLNMNTGRLHMQRVDFTLGSGANIEFLDRNNRLFYTNRGIYAGIQFDHSLNSDGRPMIGVGVSDGQHSVNDSTFRGIRIHSLGAEGEQGYGTNIVSQEFGVYSLADLSGSGYVFRLHALNGRRAIYPRYTGRFDYDLGTSQNLWSTLYVDTIRTTGSIQIRNTTGSGGYQLDTVYRDGAPHMYLRGINTGTMYYALGAPGYRFRYVYLTYQPDVSSDERLKENITDNSLGLDFIKDLSTKVFRMKNNNGHEEPLQFGIIAQQLKSTLIDHGINISNHSIVSRNGDGFYGVQSAQLIFPTIKAVQELDEKMINVKDEVNWLKIENQYLKQKIKLLEEKVS
ncbi:gp58-like family protein [Cerasibacillus sp.]|uniref:gp58-like family protein n=1 Tax=Cerasibacillus sp. TaxID=2498711 RepID=UPI002F3E751C